MWIYIYIRQYNFFQSLTIICMWQKWQRDVTFGQVWWPILRICALQLIHAHTQQWTHTHREHTPGEVGSYGAWGAVGGSVPCSRAPRRGNESGERALYIHFPTYNPCRTWNLNPQPLDYESDSLTVRPQLSRIYIYIYIYIFFQIHIKYIFTFSYWIPLHFEYIYSIYIYKCVCVCVCVCTL